jgi:hypothetical protein
VNEELVTIIKDFTPSDLRDFLATYDGDDMQPTPTCCPLSLALTHTIPADLRSDYYVGVGPLAYPTRHPNSYTVAIDINMQHVCTGPHWMIAYADTYDADYAIIHARPESDPNYMQPPWEEQKGTNIEALTILYSLHPEVFS